MPRAYHLPEHHWLNTHITNLLQALILRRTIIIRKGARQSGRYYWPHFADEKTETLQGLDHSSKSTQLVSGKSGSRPHSSHGVCHTLPTLWAQLKTLLQKYLPDCSHRFLRAQVQPVLEDISGTLTPPLPAWRTVAVPSESAEPQPTGTHQTHTLHLLEDQQVQVASDSHLLSYVPWVALHKSPGVEVQGTIFISQFQAFLSGENRIMQSPNIHRPAGAVSCKRLLAACA